MSETASSRPFCDAPWTSISLEADGGIRPCCVYRENIQHYEDVGSLTKYLKSEQLKRIKSEMQSGLIPSGCQSCVDTEACGATSKRQKIRRKIEKFGVDLPADTRLFFWQAALTNTCNLACAFCGPKYSSKWGAALARHSTDRFYLQSGYRAFSVPEDDLPALAELFESAKELILQGGEPLIAPSTVQLLRLLRASAVGADVSIDIVSNGARILPELLELLPRFDRLSLALSIDGVGPEYEIVRGIPFSRTDRTVREIGERMAGRTIVFQPTLCSLNANAVPGILNWYATLRRDMPHVRWRIAFNQFVIGPAELRLDALPQETRVGMVNEIRSLSPELLGHLGQVNLESIERAYFSNSGATPSLDLLRDFQRELEIVRGAGLSDRL